MQWIKLKGILRYDPVRKGISPQPWWCVIEIEEEIARYCRWFIQKELFLDNIYKPSWPAHITVVRGWEPKDHSVWGRHDGREVDFWLVPFMRQSGDTTGWDRPNNYWFVRTHCPWQKRIHRECGGFAPTPRGHLTIARKF